MPVDRHLFYAMEIPNMTPHKKRNLSKITQRMADDMLVRNFAPSTIDSYTWHVEKFLQFIGKPAEQAGPEEIRGFQLHLIQEKHASWSSFNQAKGTSYRLATEQCRGRVRRSASRPV